MPFVHFRKLFATACTVPTYYCDDKYRYVGQHFVDDARVLWKNRYFRRVFIVFSKCAFVLPVKWNRKALREPRTP